MLAQAGRVFHSVTFLSPLSFSFLLPRCSSARSVFAAFPPPCSCDYRGCDPTGFIETSPHLIAIGRVGNAAFMVFWRGLLAGTFISPVRESSVQARPPTHPPPDQAEVRGGGRGCSVSSAACPWLGGLHQTSCRVLLPPSGSLDARSTLARPDIIPEDL